MHTRDIGENVRTLADGTTIPCIPWKFWNYKKHNQQKSRTSRNKKKDQKSQKKNKQITQSQHELKQILTFFNIDIYPALDDLSESVLYYPSKIFSSNTMKRRRVQQEVQEEKEEENNIWSLFRTAQKEYNKPFIYPFRNIHTLAELKQHPQYDLLMQMFHLFFPD